MINATAITFSSACLIGLVSTFYAHCMASKIGTDAPLGKSARLISIAAFLYAVHTGLKGFVGLDEQTQAVADIFELLSSIAFVGGVYQLYKMTRV